MRGLCRVPPGAASARVGGAWPPRAGPARLGRGSLAWRGLPAGLFGGPARRIFGERAPKRKSLGLKLFGMSKRTAKTQKSSPCKCLGMFTLQKYAGLISFRISVYKKPGGYPLSCPTMEKSHDEVARARTTARALPAGADCSTIKLLEACPPRRDCSPRAGKTCRWPEAS